MADQQGTLPAQERASGKTALDTARLPVLLTLLAILFASAAWYSHQHWVIERHESLVAGRSAAHASTLADRVEIAARQLQASIRATISQLPADAIPVGAAASQPNARLEATLGSLRPDAERVMVLNPDDPRFDLDQDFVALALAEKVFNNQLTGPEMLYREGSWLMAIAAPIPSSNHEASLAAIFFLPADALVLPTEDVYGELRLSQTFPGVSAQYFHTVGPTNARYRITQPLDVPNWQLEFTPGVALTAQSGLLAGKAVRGVSMVLAMIALAGALTLKLRTWLLSHRAERLRKQRLQETDAQRYQQALSLLDQFHDDSESPATEIGDDALAPPFDDPPLPAVATPVQIGVLFREYDIRGDAHQLLSDELVTAIGRAIGTEALAHGDRAVVVGRDGRLSSPRLLEALTDGVLATGCDLIDLGLVPTPVMNFAALTGNATRSGVMITASHNPPADNGFKIVIAGEVLGGARIQSLYQRVLTQDFVEGQGILSHHDVQEAYLQRILSDIAPSQLKVVLDGANGVAGPLACELLSRLGCEVTPLYCEPDGNFPNHPPDPTREDNLADLKLVVRSQNADLGIALDGDGDRMVAVTSDGRVVWPDELMMIFGRDILTRQPGANIVFDVKCSHRLPQVISAYGGTPLMRRTGHSHIRNAVAETEALLGGEYSGHLFFPDRWFGFDDGLYAAARLIEVITLREQSLNDIVATLPTSVASPEVLVAVPESDKFRLIEQLLAGNHFEDADIDTTDGLRVQWPFGWGLVRASNTNAQLTLRFEADSRAHLQDIQQRFRDVLANLEPSPDISF